MLRHTHTTFLIEGDSPASIVVMCYSKTETQKQPVNIYSKTTTALKDNVYYIYINKK